MSDMEWRAGLLPGEQVMIVYHGPMGKRISLATVKKSTATQIVLSDNSRWNIATGQRVGERDAFHFTALRPFDAAALAYQAKEDEREKSALRLHQWPWRQESLEVLERVIAVLEEGKP